MELIALRIIIIVGIIALGIVDKILQNDLPQYHYGSLIERRSILVDEQNNKIEKIIIGCCVLASICIFSFIVYVSFPQEFWSGTGDYVDKIPEIIFSAVMAELSIIGILVTFNKSTYIFYSVREVLLFCNVKTRLIYTVFEMGGAFFIDFASLLLQNSGYKTLFFVVKSLNVFIFILFWRDGYYLLKAFIDIVLGYKIDRKMLRCLHKEFYYKKMRKINLKEGEKDSKSLDEILEYLLFEYDNAKKALEIEKVQDVSYEALDKIEDKYLKWGINIKSIFCVVVFVNVMCSFAIFPKYRTFLDVGAQIIINICILLILSISKHVRNVFSTIIFGRRGYIWKKNNDRKCSSEFKMYHTKDKMVNYTNSAKDILAYCLMIKGNTELYNECKKKLDEKFGNINDPLGMLLAKECFYLADANRLDSIDSVEKKIAIAILRDIDIEGVKKHSVGENKLKNNNKKEKSDVYWNRVRLETLIVLLIIIAEWSIKANIVEIPIPFFIKAFYDSSKCSDLFAQQFAISAIFISVISLVLENINDRVINLSVKRIYFKRFIYRPNYITRVVILLSQAVLSFLAFIFECYGGSIIIFVLGMYQVFRLIQMTYYFLSKRSKIYKRIWDELQSKNKAEIYNVILKKLTYIKKTYENKGHNSYYKEELKTIYLLNNIAINSRDSEHLQILQSAANVISESEGIESVNLSEDVLSEDKIDELINNLKYKAIS